MSTKRWFLPENPHLLDMLGRQADTTMAGMEALVAWADGDPAAADKVRDLEHEADDQKRELWLGLREAFSPPLDAEDLFTLSAELDEVLNSAKNLVREMEVMNLEPDKPTREMVGLIAEAVGHLVQSYTHLGSDAGRRDGGGRRRDQVPAAHRARVPRRDVRPARRRRHGDDVQRGARSTGACRVWAISCTPSPNGCGTRW